ncbi:MAG: hypothetical protein NDJ89_14130 [Oligoflexia bacterium]|nr:hypothetical protein [Oligoflexia bacterium]
MKLLYFIWLWKIATTAAIAHQFFRDKSPTLPYQRLRSLERGGFVECIQDEKSGRSFWALKRKGFDLLDDSLPVLSVEGFKTERIHHDSIVAAILLGDWLVQWPDRSSLFTEQQLRCYHKDYYPPWIPRSLDRRPDGFWKAYEEFIGALRKRLSGKGGALPEARKDIIRYVVGSSSKRGA